MVYRLRSLYVSAYPRFMSLPRPMRSGNALPPVKR
jgi:hypothetical protein